MTSDRRADLTVRLADHVLAHGLGAASLRALAAGVGTSDRMLLYYFPDKAALLAAVLGEAGRRMTVHLETRRAPRPMLRDRLVAHLLPVLLAADLWPYMRLWLDIAARAAGGDAICRTIGEGVARSFLAWGGAQLDCADADRPAEAARLMATIEGAVLLKSLGLDDALAAAFGTR